MKKMVSMVMLSLSLSILSLQGMSPDNNNVNNVQSLPSVAVTEQPKPVKRLQAPGLRMPEITEASVPKISVAVGGTVSAVSAVVIMASSACVPCAWPALVVGPLTYYAVKNWLYKKTALGLCLEAQRLLDKLTYAATFDTLVSWQKEEDIALYAQAHPACNGSVQRLEQHFKWRTEQILLARDYLALAGEKKKAAELTSIHADLLARLNEYEKDTMKKFMLIVSAAQKVREKEQARHDALQAKYDAQHERELDRLYALQAGAVAYNVSHENRNNSIAVK